MAKAKPQGRDGAPQPWWETGVVYQIYPRSFQDTDGDGVGDLPGILARLDHLVDLGIDAIWISPFYPSPMADFGYDVADHVGVDPLFGTLADFDAVLAGAHARGLKVILDYVPNHTSDRHPWFVEAAGSRTSPKRGWYIWHDPAPDGGPPNNWLSEFGGSAWTLHADSGQYYYHAFLEEQPDLDWRNPEVVEAMHGVLRFWLDRGVDGFRVDALWHVIKDAQFRDNPPNPDFRPGMNPHVALTQLHTGDQPELMDVIAGLRALADRYGALLIGEAYLPLERLGAYYGADGKGGYSGVHLPFNFALLTAPWQAAELAQLIADYEAALPEGGWPNWVLSNHDRPRVAGRLGPDQARVAAMLLLTLRGTPTLYYGDEIGMTQIDIPADKVRDPFGIRVPGHGRDGARTPMQWDDGPFGGFSAVEPWLPLAPDWTEVNVRTERGEGDSMLTLTRALLTLRRSHAALNAGSYRLVNGEGDLLAYERRSGAERLLVALNLGDAPLSAVLPGIAGAVVLSTFCDRADERMAGGVDLRPAEGVVVRLDP